MWINIEKYGKTLKMTFSNKKFILFLLNDLNLNFKNKTFEGEIPEDFLGWSKSKHVIRGLFETDGSLYFTRTKPSNLAKYPRLEIKTSSKKLSLQLVN